MDSERQAAVDDLVGGNHCPSHSHKGWCAHASYSETEPCACCFNDGDCVMRTNVS